MAGASPTMTQLSLAGLSRDGARMLLVSDDGSQFALNVDDELRAALRGDHVRIGQLEIQMESALRPRDIQARIRAGETPEMVAKAAQTSVEQIMPYAAPVLAERAHIADRAQRASLRPSPGSARRVVDQSGPPGGRTLADGVAGHLRPQHVDPETVQWDAWRREDGRWMLTAAYCVGTETGVARFAFDAPGNFVTSENDEARWLVGEPTTDESKAITAPDEAMLADDLDLARRRRSREAVEAESPERTEEAEPEAVDASTVDLSETAERIRSAEFEPPRREVTKTRGRASVPSWDEIMFGKGE